MRPILRSQDCQWWCGWSKIIMLRIVIGSVVSAGKNQIGRRPAKIKKLSNLIIRNDKKSQGRHMTHDGVMQDILRCNISECFANDRGARTPQSSALRRLLWNVVLLTCRAIRMECIRDAWCLTSTNGVEKDSKKRSVFAFYLSQFSIAETSIPLLQLCMENSPDR